MKDDSEFSALLPDDTPAPLEKSHILIIDDSPDSLYMLRGLLEDIYRVTLANSGAQGLAIASPPNPPRYRTRTLNRGKFMGVNLLQAAWPLSPLALTARLREWFWPRSCAYFGERNTHPVGKICNALSVVRLACRLTFLFKVCKLEGGL